MKNVIKLDRLVGKLFWLIKLRWIAVFGVIVTVTFIARFLKVNLPIQPLYIVTLFLAVYNVVFYFLSINVKNGGYRNLYKNINRLASIQISLDLASLAALIHFSGGIENPFIFYFIFHVIIAGMLLPRISAFLQTTFAVILYSLVVLLEYFGVLPHYCLGKFMLVNLHNQPLYIAGISFVFISTMYIATYMASSVSNELRRSEKNLRKANRLLMEQDRIKSEYVLRVSHDVKGHLAAIQACIEPVTEGIVGDLGKKQTFLLEKAVRRVNKLLTFVRALLEITRIKLSKEVEEEEFSVGEVINNVVSSARGEAKDRGIELRVDIDSNVDGMRGVKTYIEEVIINILANSIKYTLQGGVIDIVAKKQENSVFIQIKDTGIGIPEEELDRIFDEFHRAPNAKKIERDGTGLGLSIVKQIIERHNGKVWAESEIKKGTCVNIILPK